MRKRALAVALFATAVTAGLGFGAAQAVASPGQGKERGAGCYQVCADQCGPAGGYPTRNGICLCCGPE